jgi:hypothetical protein
LSIKAIARPGSSLTTITIEVQTILVEISIIKNLSIFEAEAMKLKMPHLDWAVLFRGRRYSPHYGSRSSQGWAHYRVLATFGDRVRNVFGRRQMADGRRKE